MKITDLSGKVALANGSMMPYFGLGVFEMDTGAEVINAVNYALTTGYRLIDTAAAYDNEAGVGKAVRESPLGREEIFITSKIWNTDQGYEETFKAFDRSLKKMKIDYLDLYLIHWPVKEKYKDTWKAMEILYKQDRIRAIGVSNFLQHHLEDLMASTEIYPMVNQVEFHPRLVQQDLIDFCNKNNIQLEAWSPIMKGKVNNVREIRTIADKYGKSPVQVVLRWDLQKGVITIPKSSNPDHIRSNADIFDFELSADDMNTIDNLDQKSRIGQDPDNFQF
jgi:diketogulonate reductase-like aldo/keto reductase